MERLSAKEHTYKKNKEYNHLKPTN